jgi:DNA-binding MarR family transcriptional regulator
MPEAADPALLASELRLALGQLVRRLRVEHRLSLSHVAVLARLDREGTHSISTLAAAERIRPQSMAQTIRDLESDGLIARRADPTDGRRTLVDLTAKGLGMLEEDRRRRQGWLT